MNYQVVKKSSPSEIAKAGLKGAVIGAGVAVATAKILSDKGNREKVKEALSQAKDTLSSVGQKVTSEAKDVAQTTGKKIDNQVEKVDKKAAAVSKDIKRAN